VAKYSNDEIKARLILIVGVGLTLAFVGSIFSLIYGLLFVTQPLEQSPNDSEAFSVLNPMLMTLSGGLIGLLASNGLKSKPKGKDDETE
jgi:O-antigen/teichoic acid export membrane protein